MSDLEVDSYKGRRKVGIGVAAAVRAVRLLGHALFVVEALHWGKQE